MLLTIYVRSAFAELLAASFLPLLVLWIVRERPARAMFVPLALTIAGVWLTNVPAAIIASYVAVLLLATVTIFRRNSRVFLYGVAAMAMGMLLASFYIVPVLYEKNWITVGQVLSAGVRPAENFLFTRIGEPEHDAFLRTLSWLAVGNWRSPVWPCSSPADGAGAIPRLVVAGHPGRRVARVDVAHHQPGLSLHARPALPSVPWRWLMVTGIAYAVFVVAAVPSFRGKASLYAVLFVGLIAVCNLALQPQCDPEDTPFMLSSCSMRATATWGPTSTLPQAATITRSSRTFPSLRFAVRMAGAGSKRTGDTLPRGPYRKQLTVESSQPVEIVLRLMNYPAWRVEVNGSNELRRSRTIPRDAW
jgi:hypothetical protein